MDRRIPDKAQKKPEEQGTSHKKGTEPDFTSNTVPSVSHIHAN